MAEYISLWWDTDRAPPEYIRGHVTEAEALEAIARESGSPAGGYSLKHRWARWEFAGDCMRACGCERVLRAYDEQRRGMFAVTEMTPESESDG